MNSDKKIFSFLGHLGGKRLILLSAVLTLGLLLLLIGGRESVSTEPSLEETVAELCSGIDGVGECRVMLTLNEDGGVASAAVICEGGGSVEVRAAVSELISRLFGIGKNRISVLRMAK